MQRFLLSVLVILTIFGVVYSQNLPMDYDTKVFRESRDRDFRNPDLTPLLTDDLANFKGLKFYDFDKKFRIQAIFEKTVERKSFLMPTTTGTTRKYLKIGDLRFSLDGKEFILGAYFIEYSPDHPKAKEAIIDVFVPFKDLTNGEETNSAGRYLYVRLPKEGDSTFIDFNLAYNPNCAYGNENISCTLPPKENFLKVEIKAGEKIFKTVGNKQ